MTLRLGGAICVAMAMFAYSSSSTSAVKSDGAVRGTAAARVLLARASMEHERSVEHGRKDPGIALKSSAAAVPKVPANADAATPDAPPRTQTSGAAKADATIATATAVEATPDATTKSAVVSDVPLAAPMSDAPGSAPPVSGVRTSGAAKIAAAIARALSAGATIRGVASTYNPFRAADTTAGGIETASGERYDPRAWTAAIQTDLRGMFGGVHFGKDYRPCYALVVKDNKQAIIKINDVGPLEPGRVIDLNEQTMRYFDPSFELGVLGHVSVTPLVGDGWLTGPIAANN